MKKHLFFLFTCLVAYSSSMMAQNVSYRAAIKEYLSVNGGDTQKKMDMTITKITPYAVKLANGAALGNINSQACAKKYIETQLQDDIVDIFVPYFYEQNITEDNLNEVIQLSKNPDYVAANKHINEITVDGTLQKELIDKLIPAVVMIYSKQNPQDIRPSAPHDYMVKFHSYYEAAGMQAIINTLCDLLFTQSQSQKLI